MISVLIHVKTLLYKRFRMNAEGMWIKMGKRNEITFYWTAMYSYSLLYKLLWTYSVSAPFSLFGLTSKEGSVWRSWRGWNKEWCGLVGIVVLGWWLELMVVEVFSSFNESIILQKDLGIFRYPAFHLSLQKPNTWFQIHFFKSLFFSVIFGDFSNYC